MQSATCRVKCTFFEHANTHTEHMQNVSILIANFLTPDHYCSVVAAECIELVVRTPTEHFHSNIECSCSTTEHPGNIYRTFHYASCVPNFCSVSDRGL